MSEEYRETSGNTEAFRVFAEREEPARPLQRTGLIVGASIAVLVVLAAVVWVALG